MGNRLAYPEVDLSGRVAVVTGGNNGIGYETAKALAAMGAHTIIACRSKEKAEEVASYAISHRRPRHCVRVAKDRAVVLKSQGFNSLLAFRTLDR